MKLLLYTDADVFAGTERHMLDLAAGLRSLSVPVQIGCPAPSPLADRAQLQNIPVIPIAKRGLVDFAAARLLKKLLRSKELDIIHAHNGRTHLAAAIAVARAGRGTCIATQHFLSPSRTSRSGPKAWLSNAAHGWVSRKTSRFIAISAAVKSEAVSRESALAARMDVVLNGMQAPNVAALKPPAEVRNSLGVSPDTPMIFCAARLQKEKDILTLINAMKHVIAPIPAARCFIAGEGEEKTSLQSAIIASNLASHVQLLGFRTDILDLMQAADLFVLPSLAEPFGLVLLEAMSLATPVIATRAGGPPEIVDDNVTGLLTSPQDPQDLAGAITRLLADSSLRQQFGAAGRQRFHAHFTAQRMAAETLAVYHAVMEHAQV